MIPVIHQNENSIHCENILIPIIYDEKNITRSVYGYQILRKVEIHEIEKNYSVRISFDCTNKLEVNHSFYMYDANLLSSKLSLRIYHF